MARNGVNRIVAAATDVLAEIPGGERLVLQAVKDMLEELRELRGKNAHLVKENQKLKERVVELQGRAKPRRPTVKASARTRTSAMSGI